MVAKEINYQTAGRVTKIIDDEKDSVQYEAGEVNQVNNKKLGNGTCKEGASSCARKGTQVSEQQERREAQKVVST